MIFREILYTLRLYKEAVDCREETDDRGVLYFDWIFVLCL